MNGQPTKYRESMCQAVKDMMAQGMAKKAVSKELGIDFKSFLKYIDKHPEFAEAVEQGMVLAEIYWQDKYEKAALGESKANPAMMIFYMKNRFKWTDRIEQKVETQALPTLDEWEAQD